MDNESRRITGTDYAPLTSDATIIGSSENSDYNAISEPPLDSNDSILHETGIRASDWMRVQSNENGRIPGRPSIITILLVGIPVTALVAVFTYSSIYEYGMRGALEPLFLVALMFMLLKPAGWPFGLSFGKRGHAPMKSVGGGDFKNAVESCGISYVWVKERVPGRHGVGRKVTTKLSGLQWTFDTPEGKHDFILIHSGIKSGLFGRVNSIAALDICGGWARLLVSDYEDESVDSFIDGLGQIYGDSLGDTYDMTYVDSLDKTSYMVVSMI